MHLSQRLILRQQLRQSFCFIMGRSLVSVLPALILMGLTSQSIAASTKPIPADGGGDVAIQLAPLDNRVQQVSEQVRLQVSRDFNLPVSRIHLVNLQHVMWPDSCLGLGREHQSCLMAAVDGWYVQLTDGTRQWRYRTDETAQLLVLEPQLAGRMLPAPAADRLLQVAASQTRLPVNQLRIVDAEPQMWNACLGIAPASNEGCAEIAISGWRVIVAGPQRTWIYHANDDASDVRLNSAVTQALESTTVAPVFLSSEAPAPALGKQMIFRAIARTGRSGQPVEVTLLNNGQIMQSRPTPEGDMVAVQIGRISSRQVHQFERFLQQSQFVYFDGLLYRAGEGDSDYTSITLSSQAGSFQYADLAADDLPASLQQVVQIWTRISSARPTRPSARPPA